SLCAAVGPPARPAESTGALQLPRFEAPLPPGALGRFGGDRFATLRSLEAITFGEGDKELQGWDGHTPHRWEVPAGRPLGRDRLPPAVQPNGLPFAYTALAPHRPQVAWIRFHADRERLQVWDFRQKKLVLDCDVTLDDKDLDYAALVWSEDASRLLTFINDKR